METKGSVDILGEGFRYPPVQLMGSAKSGSVIPVMLSDYGELLLGSIISISGSVGIKDRAYVGTPLLKAQHQAAGSTQTSDWYGIGGFETKTIGINQTAAGSVTIDVAFVDAGTSDPQEFYTDDVAAGSFEVKSFTEAVQYTRVKAYMTGTPSTTKGTVTVWLGER